MDGWITIGTELKTDKFDKQISNLERKMKKEEDKKIEIETKMDANIKDLEDARKEVDRLAESYQRMKHIQDRLQAGKGKPSDFSTFQEMENQFGSLEKLGTSYDKALTKQDQLESKANQMKKQFEEINQNVSDYATKIASVKFNKQQAEINQVKQGFDKVGSSIQNAVRQAGRMVLSIIGIRTGLAMLRRASGELASYDTQYATNLEYIRFALTQMIAPVLKYIVELVATILQYINAIVSAWFGINLFSNASAKAFQNMKAGAGGTAKAVKEIKKQLSGFDEINMLSDTSSSGAGGGGGGISSPSFDLGQNVKIPKWLQWIIDNKDLILAILGGIAGAIAAIKLGLGGIKSLGIGVLIFGIIKLIEDVLKYLEDPSWENFGKIIEDIGLIIIGVGIIIGSIPAIVVGVLTLIVGYVVKHWDKIKEKIQGGLDWLKSKTDWVREHFGIVGEVIYRIFVNMLDSLFRFVDNTITSIKRIFDGFIKFFKGVFSGDWETAIEGLGDIFGGFIDLITGLVDWLFGWIGDIFGGIIDTIRGAIDPDTYQRWANEFEYWWNNEFLGGLIKEIKLKFNIFGNFSGGGGAGGGSSYSGGRALGAIYFPPKMKLATGGIINMPGRGVPLGYNIGGERGAEGVIPLTQNQAMEALGYEIGKNIVMNLTNVVEMNGRVIGRELKKVKSQQDFAYNR